LQIGQRRDANVNAIVVLLLHPFPSIPFHLAVHAFLHFLFLSLHLANPFAHMTWPMWEDMSNWPNLCVVFFQTFAAEICTWRR
jgi:hypothetical protein